MENQLIDFKNISELRHLGRFVVSPICDCARSNIASNFKQIDHHRLGSFVSTRAATYPVATIVYHSDAAALWL